MAKQILKLHSTANFSSYLKRFSIIEKSLLLEIEDGKFIAKTYTPDRAVVKTSSILLTEIFESTASLTPVKIGMYAVDNFMQTFKHLGESDVKFEVTSENIKASGEAATEIRINNKSLKFNFPAASLTLFKYIDSNMISTITDTKDALFSFRVDKDVLAKISSLCSIDSENDTLKIEAKDGNLFFSGKSFQLNLPGITVDHDASISFYKAHYGFVDKEDSEIYVMNNKVIFRSLESDTRIVIGHVG